jgi:hypothetical protein
MTPSVQRAYGLIPKRARDYSHMFSHATIMHHATTQYSLKKGLRKLQKVGEDRRVEILIPRVRILEPS